MTAWLILLTFEYASDETAPKYLHWLDQFICWWYVLTGQYCSLLVMINMLSLHGKLTMQRQHLDASICLIALYWFIFCCTHFIYHVDLVISNCLIIMSALFCHGLLTVCQVVTWEMSVNKQKGIGHQRYLILTMEENDDEDLIPREHCVHIT